MFQPLKLIPKDYTTSSSKAADYSTMTKLVNQAKEQPKQHSTNRKSAANRDVRPKWKQ
jgi:hypothetical protein